MGYDAQIKRFFPLIVCALIALAAYLQASGMGQLIAASVSGAPESGSAAGALASLAGSPPPRKSGKPILARNPFDSVTGPLDGRSEPIPDVEPKEVAEASGEPTESDPPCNFGKVTLITASDDPDWSFAAIRDQSGASKLRRMGDEISGHTIQAMSWDTVWLSGNGSRCRMKLGDDSGPAATPAKPAPRSASRPARRSRRDLSPEMAAKISKVSDTEFNVERSLVDEILENQAELMRSARIVPEKEGDEVVGIRLFGIRDGTLLGHLGMQNGDRLESINGFKMSDPQKALEAYGRLRTANKLSVQVNRKGTPMTLEFNIQ